jgi:hypothetical protein
MARTGCRIVGADARPNWTERNGPRRAGCNDSAKVMTMRSSSSGKPIRAGARQIADLLYQKFPRDHTEQREGRIKLYGVAPPAGLCFRKPFLIASLIPSSINVFATSGTLVP